MRWSRLQRKLEDLFDPKLNLRIFCTVHRSDKGGPIGRYWITLDKEIIWEVPKRVAPLLSEGRGDESAPQITELLRNYLDFSPEALCAESFELDSWGLFEILRSADRRVGKRRLEALRKRANSEIAQHIMKLRLDA